MTTPQLSRALEKNVPELFGGLWIQHDPEFKVIVKLTDEESTTIDSYVKGSRIENLIEMR